MPSHHADSIDAIFTTVDEPKTKRITPPKRTQIRKETSQTTNQPNMKILTSNQPVSQHGVVSADEPTVFQPFEKVNLSDGVAPTAVDIEFEGPTQIPRALHNPSEKKRRCLNVLKAG